MKFVKTIYFKFNPEASKMIRRQDAAFLRRAISSAKQDWQVLHDSDGKLLVYPDVEKLSDFHYAIRKEDMRNVAVLYRSTYEKQYKRRIEPRFA